MTSTLSQRELARAGMRATSRARYASAARAVSRACYWAAAFAAPVGLLLGSSVAVCMTAFFLSIAFVASDVARGNSSVSAITVYSLSSALIAAANTIALRAADTEKRSLYFVYMVEEHIYLASLLALAGSVIPVVTFWLISRSSGARVLLELLPRVRGRVSDRSLVTLAVAGSAIAMTARTMEIIPSLGALSSMFASIPNFAVVVLARAGMARRVRGALLAALLVAAVEAIRSVLFEYLRVAMLAPFAAFTVGAVVGARSLKPLRTIWFTPVYAAAAAFFVYFGAFASVRATSGIGVTRISELQEYQSLDEQATVSPRQTVLSRATTLNQLTQVGRVVREDGFLNGATLEYLGYAFIPRVLWRDKPTIAKGAWFALRIGQANVDRDGRIHNSVNMTIPGELYLNFGWLGVVSGLIVFGLLLSVLWSRTAFWEDASNVLGTAFGFYLMWVWVGFSLGADLQIIVTMIAMYVAFAGIGTIQDHLAIRRTTLAGRYGR